MHSVANLKTLCEIKRNVTSCDNELNLSKTIILMWKYNQTYKAIYSEYKDLSQIPDLSSQLDYLTIVNFFVEFGLQLL